MKDPADLAKEKWQAGRGEEWDNYREGGFWGVCSMEEDCQEWHIARVWDDAVVVDGEAHAPAIAALPDLIALALAYEQWEADLILCDECWHGLGRPSEPQLTTELWDRLLEIQTMRNKAIAKIRGEK